MDGPCQAHEELQKPPAFQDQPCAPVTCALAQSSSLRPWRLGECVSVAILTFLITSEQETPHFHVAQIRSLVWRSGDECHHKPHCVSLLGFVLDPSGWWARNPRWLITEIELPSRCGQSQIELDDWDQGK